VATLYAKAAGGNWTAAATWSNTGSGGGDSSGPPTAADNCILESGSGNVTINAAAVCRSLDCTSGTGSYAGTLTQNNNIVCTIGDATAGPGNVALKFSAGMTYTLSGNGGGFAFASTSGTQQTIDTQAKVIGAQGIAISGTGSNYQLAANIETNGSWNYTATSATFDANGKSITLDGSSSSFIGGGKTYSTVTFASTVNSVFFSTSSATIGTLSWSPAGANNSNSMTLNGVDITVTSAFTLAGANASLQRMLLKSGTRGTQRTITNTGATMTWSNIDCEDIKLTTTYNASSITGKSGDCGGNSGITFTTGINCYAVLSGSANYSDSVWFTTSGGATPARVPLPQDTAVFDANTPTGTPNFSFDMIRVGGINVTGLAATIFTSNIALTIYGNVVLNSFFSLSNTNTFTLVTRSTLTVTSNGVTMTESIAVDAPGGTVTFSDALTTSATAGLTLTQGTLSLSATTTVKSFSSSNTNTRTLTAGSNLLINGTGTVWTTTTGTNLTMTGTAKFTDTSNTAITFSGGGTLANVWFARGGSTASITIAGSTTFSDFKDTGTVAHSILFTTGTTQTFTTFTVSGSSGNLITINSTTTGTHALVKAGGGTITCDYVSVQHSVASPSRTWLATNSTNNQSVATAGSGWSFDAFPPPSGFFFFM